VLPGQDVTRGEMLLENARVDKYKQQHQAADVGREGQEGPFVN
jgi:hypothetical protein